jgi:hypothetical protein
VQSENRIEEDMQDVQDKKWINFLLKFYPVHPAILFFFCYPLHSVFLGALGVLIFPAMQPRHAGCIK